MDVIEEYGGPMLDRYGRTALVVGVAVVATVGIALLVARRRRRQTFTEKIQRVIPDSVGSRLEGPMSSIRSAAERISR
jgi:molybdopterin-guanine dinucleotide biosynthesis protein A